MNHDPESLATALSARIEYDPNSKHDLAIFRFSDDRLQYELHILPKNGTAQLAMDPKDPIQACPMLEFSFRCTDVVIGKSAYGDDEIAVRFFENDVSNDGLRLTMTWLPSGNWYDNKTMNRRQLSHRVNHFS